MKTSTTTAIFSLLAALAAAAPAPQNSGFQAQITFQGAAGAQFTESVPTDGSVFYINNVLSISHIESDGRASCTFHGIDGSTTTVVGAETVDVGPPQTQIWGTCDAF